MRRLFITTILSAAALALSASPAASEEAITITSGPGTGENLPINAATGTWTFDTSQATGPFECAVSPSTSTPNWQPCTSPVTLPIAGSSSFMVRTVSTLASANVWFIVDRTEPRAILGWLPNPHVPNGWASFPARTPSIPVDNNKGMTMWPDGSPREYVTYTCSIDSGPYAPCVPVNRMLEFPGLSEGTHTLAVKAHDLAGNTQVEPSTFRFEYLLTPATPVPIVELPTRTTSRKIKFQVLFRQTVPGLAKCDLDGKRLTGGCNAELKVEPGEHVYRVWGESDGGVVGQAFEWRWTVVDAPVASGFRHLAPVKPAALKRALARCTKLVPRKRAACRDALAGDRYGALRFQLDEKARVTLAVSKAPGKPVLARAVVQGTPGANEAPLRKRLRAGRYTVTATAGNAEPVTETFTVR
jgi:large repetitive protein